MRSGRAGLLTVLSVTTALACLPIGGEMVPGALAATADGRRPIHKPGHHRRPAADGGAVAVAQAPVRPARRRAAAASPEAIDVVAHASRFGFDAQQHQAGSTTMLSEEALISHHVNTVMDLQKLVPNLTIQTESGSNAPSFYLRGIGLEDYTQNNMPSVMTYFDGVAYPLSPMSSGQMFDIATVGVDPGPVGFTHGMADTGGEVRIESRAPTRTLHYGASEDLATRDRSKTTLYVSGPITNSLQYRLAGQTVQGGAYRFNRVSGQSIGNANLGALRGRLAWQPDAKTDIDLIANWSMDESDATAGFILDDFSAVSHMPRDRNIYATGWSLNPAFAKLVGIAPHSIPSYDDVTWGITLKAARDLGWATLQTIGNFSQQQRHEYVDRDASAFRSGDSFFAGNSNVFSQEVSLKGRPVLDGRLEWIAGMYYNQARAFGANWFDMSDTAGYIRDSFHNQPQENFSQFATLDYHITHTVKFTFGLQHQSDTRSLVGDTVAQYYYLPSATKRAHCGADPAPCASANPFPTHGALTNQFSGKVGLSWQARPNLLLYADIARGVKPGGFTTNTTVANVQIQPFKPEWVLAYEVGFKSDFFRRRLRLNGALFWDDYHDKQMLGTLVIPGALGAYNPEGAPGTYGSYINIPHAQLWGTEVQIEANPVRGLTLSQSIGYLRGKYTDYQQVNSAAVAANFTRTGFYSPVYTNYDGADMGMPKLTLNGQVSYETRPVFRRYTLTFEGNYSYRDLQDSLQPRGSGVYVVPAYFLMGGSITLRPRNGHWFVTAYASNILNRHYIDVVPVAATTVLMGISGEPRFVGGRFGCDF